LGAISQFNWSIAKIKIKIETMEAPQNRRFYGKMECHPLWPTYIYLRRGGLWAKHKGVKVRCYWEHPWGTHWEPKEHIENLMGIHWELEWGRCWEQRKK
jgi:hypothetical protein